MNRLFSSPLSRSFAFMVIITSTMITTIVTLAQLWFDYQLNIASTHDVLDQVESSYSASLTSSLWIYDNGLVQSQLEGITNLKEIEAAEIISEDGTHWKAGEQSSTYTLKEEVPLIYESDGRTQSLGNLILVSSLDNIYSALARKFFVILSLNFVKTLCMSIFIIFLFYRIVGRHLIDLSSYLSGLRLTGPGSAFSLRRARRPSQVDELDQLTTAINTMHTGLKSSYDEVTVYRDKLETALERERELSGLQRQFVWMVSHEFRTPLAIIDGNARRLQRAKEQTNPKKAGGFLENIRLSVRRLIELMESVLSSANLEDGKIKFDPGEFDIGGMLREICSGYRELNQDHQIEQDLDRLPELVVADEKLLRQVFSNLISNAIKYSPDGTTVVVTGYGDGPSHIVISVSDKGVGIPADELEKLFNRFFRASTSTGIPGTGIGLHLAKHLIEMHDGTIAVESVPGEGSTFIIRLPTVSSVPQEEADGAPREGHTNKGSELALAG